MTSPPANAITVVEITAQDTHALRRAVLRGGEPSASVDFPEDHLRGVWHLGVVGSGGEAAPAGSHVLIGVSSWVPRPLNDRHAVQLRGMATAAARQRSGVGTALLAEGVRRAASLGCELVWANARDSSASFYARHGFVVEGDGFVTADTGLAHHRMVRRL